MSKPMVRIHNSETNEIIDREMTDAEFAEHQASVADMQAKLAEKEVKQASKEALLERLGITEDEAKLLLA